MKPREMIISLLVISAVAIGLSSYFVSLMNSYPGIGFDNSSLSSFNQLNSTMSMLNTVESNTTKSMDQGLLSDIAFIIGSGINIMKFFLVIPALYSAMITSITTIIGLPSWVGLLASGIIIVYIIFAILSVIVNRGDI
jgi:hypothetical protein